jgi:hypothetical protein
MNLPLGGVQTGVYTESGSLVGEWSVLFWFSKEARAIDVCDKNKFCLSQDDRQCHMGKACSKAPPFGVHHEGSHPRKHSVVLSKLRTLDAILKKHIAHSRTHILPSITSLNPVSTAHHQARVGQHGFIASFGCFLNLLTSPSFLQTFSQHVGATSNVSLIVPGQACRTQCCSERQCSYPLGYLPSSHSLVCQLVHAQ